MHATLESFERCGESLYYVCDRPARARDTGKSVLVLHGFPDTPTSFAPLGHSLSAAGYHVLRPYLPGYAPSFLRDPLTIDRARDRLLDLVAAFGGSDWQLVGHDWGAILGYSLLAAEPARFSRAATISVPHPAHLVPRGLKSLSQLRRSLYVLLFQLPWLPERALHGRLELVSRLCQRWSPGHKFEERVLAEIETCLRASGSAPFDYYRDFVRVWFASKGLQEPIKTPLLYLHGREDGCIGPRLATGQERFFGTEFESELLDCGHFPHMELPEQLAGRLTRWFAR